MDHLGFENDGLVPTVDFEYPSEDDGESLSLPGTHRDLRVAMRAVLGWVREAEGWRSRLIRLAAASYVLDVEPGRRLREYADEVRISSGHRGVTRAAVSAAAVEFCDRYGYQKPGMKTASARVNMAAARHRVVKVGAMGLSRNGKQLCAQVFLLRFVLRAKGANNQQMAVVFGVSTRNLLRWVAGAREPSGAQAERIRELAEQYAGDLQKTRMALAGNPGAMLQYQKLVQTSAMN